jgi:hypothetical protein
MYFKSVGASADIENHFEETSSMLMNRNLGKRRNFKDTGSNLLSYRKNSKKIANELNFGSVFRNRDIASGKEKFPIRWVNVIDDESNPDPFVYITYGLSKQADLLPGPSIHFGNCICQWGGNCYSASRENLCSCIALTNSQIGENFFEIDSQLRSYKLTSKALQDIQRIYECSDICTCGILDCPNRVVQRGLQWKVEVFKQSNSKWALRTLDFIQKGSFVIEFVGEIVKIGDAQKRVSSNRDFSFWKIRSEGKKIIDHYAIDPYRFGNAARFIRHSCDPNLIAKEVFVEHRDHRYPRIAFFAAKNISDGDELTVDFGSNQSDTPFLCIICDCKMPNCRIHLT